MNFECDNLAICISRLGLNPESDDTRTALGYAALEAGDMQAAYAEFNRGFKIGSNNVSTMIYEYLGWKVEVGGARTIDPALKSAIEPLEKILAIEEKIDGKDSKSLSHTLSSLANSYARCGEYKKAAAMYARLIELEHKCLNYQLEYVNMLVNIGRSADARKYLEQQVQFDPGYGHEPVLAGYLLKLYGDAHMKQKIRDALIHIRPYAPPESLASSDPNGYTVRSLAGQPYSRNGIIYRE